MKDAYLDKMKAMPWNKGLEENTYIALVAHGTDLAVARAVSQTGFANLSKLVITYPIYDRFLQGLHLRNLSTKTAKRLD